MTFEMAGRGKCLLMTSSGKYLRISISLYKFFISAGMMRCNRIFIRLWSYRQSVIGLNLLIIT